MRKSKKQEFNKNNKQDTEFGKDNVLEINDQLTDVSTLLKSCEKTVEAIFPKKHNS